MTERICGNCKHLGSKYVFEYIDEQGNEQIEPFNTCARIGHINDCFDTSHTVMCKDQAVVTDGSGYYAAVRVKEDFGCTMWEAK